MDYVRRAHARGQALAQSGHACILAIESSCDETAVAVVRDGRQVLSSVIASQIAVHAPYGGVVPEIASRQHVESIGPLVDEALGQACVGWQDIDALAVTQGPGLVGALLVGVAYAKALAFARDVPLVPVHHIEGHVSANYIAHPALVPPFVCLVASGGHSHILDVRDYGQYRVLGCTQDDAAGEAFDKAARVLGLAYPGGPLLDALAEQGDPQAFALPKPRPEGAYDYSFSGLKTALMQLVHRMRQRGEDVPAADIAASFRSAVVESLVERAARAAQDTDARALVLAGGVAANRLLRVRLAQEAERIGLPFFLPPLALCGDNAAMIGSAAYYRLMRGVTADLALNADPGLSLLG